MLKNENYLVPNYSQIRLMWNSDRGDEHFLIDDKFMLIGIEAGAHSGRNGKYNPEEILAEDVCWEAQNLKHKSRLCLISPNLD